VAILGGSFDPPTLSHYQTCIEAINSGYVDEAWMMPCGDRKDKNLVVTGERRLQMLNLGIRDLVPSDFPLKTSDFEIRHPEYLPTYTVMKMLENDPKHTDIEFYFLMGSDLIKGLNQWHDADKLQKEIRFLIMKRIGYAIEDKNLLPLNTTVLNEEPLPLSSTLVRSKVKEVCRKYHTHNDVKAGEDSSVESSTKVGDIKVPMELSNLSANSCSVTKKKRDIEEKYLNLLGSVPLSIINYIRENNLYCDISATK